MVTIKIEIGIVFSKAHNPIPIAISIPMLKEC
jgi:hypothetical protein